MIVLINPVECSDGNSNGRKKWQELLLVDAFPKLTMKKRVGKLSDVDLNIWLKNHLIQDQDRSSFVKVIYKIVKILEV